MPRYRKVPTEIEAIEFRVGAPIPDTVRIQAAPAEEELPYAVWNHLHQSWIGLREGDMIRVDQAPQDVYPIDRDTFERTYEPLEEES